MSQNQPYGILYVRALCFFSPFFFSVRSVSVHPRPFKHNAATIFSFVCSCPCLFVCVCVCGFFVLFVHIWTINEKCKLIIKGVSSENEKSIEYWPFWHGIPSASLYLSFFRDSTRMWSNIDALLCLLDVCEAFHDNTIYTRLLFSPPTLSLSLPIIHSSKFRI